VNALQHKVLEPFVVETLSALETLAGITATAGEPFEDRIDSFRFRGYAVATHVRGAVVAGKVLLHLYPESVDSVGQLVFDRMMGNPGGDATHAEIEDALSEWANVLIGKATRGLERSQLDVTFAPPFFVHDTTAMDAIMDGVVEIMSVPINTENAGRFYFNYLLHERTAA
jgi:CheY-specific phosphatase CheX